MTTSPNLLQHFQKTSALSGANADFIEILYEQFLRDPESVSKDWSERFSQLLNGTDFRLETPHSPIRSEFKRFGSTLRAGAAAAPVHTELTTAQLEKQSSVTRLINQFRVSGHQQANYDPLNLFPQPSTPDLDPFFYGLNDLDMETVFDTGTLFGAEKLPLKTIIAHLEETYCRKIGFEYSHIVDVGINGWLAAKIEANRGHCQLDAETKRWQLTLLTAAEGIEKFLHRKYVGQKRFSLEGGECLIPLLDELVQRAGSNGTREMVIGMAHRGRLNVLINILGKKPSILFEEFEGRRAQQPGSGDVKYHLGYSSDVATLGGAIHLALAFNPSHLEIISPVVEGSVRARQDRRGGDGEAEVMPVLIHGDAAFAGQGVVMETLNLSATRAYSTGGTVHIVINNQIGFTTSNPFDARSSLYCTDVANMVQAPVFHVNGDDPEAVLYVTQLALDYRMEFHKDVVIDMICYRRHGHNEADEPAVTQPMMYKKIRNHPTTRTLYAEQLVNEGVMSETEVTAMEEKYRQDLEQGDSVARPLMSGVERPYKVRWSGFIGTSWDVECDTTLPLERLRALSDKMLMLPPEFELHGRVEKIMESRSKMSAGALPIDWGYAENMAYATLVTEGYGVRISGQDVGRGTFFHRHAILINQLNGSNYIPLTELSDDQARFEVYNSLLSEEGVLGFEYGYSTAEPDILVVWEAQFGDFANGAQVVVDQFISSGESKWGRMCSLTMLLPHGYEGQGAEHSSARLERYLQLCAEHNMQVCVPTTPAQIFHLLRRQMIRPYRKPLVVLSPKSLLRHKLAVSTLEDLCQGAFQPLIHDVEVVNPKKVKRVILCSGKVYYDLFEARRSLEVEGVAIIRIEQLYPFPTDLLRAELGRYSKLKTLVWCQEEPKNQGAWHQVRHRFLPILGEHVELVYAGRELSAAPAVGSFSIHIEQQKQLVETALIGLKSEE